MLLGVPNVSEGRDLAAVERIGVAFAAGASLLDVHSDSDHDRSVFTLAAPAANLPAALESGARTAMETIDMRAHTGLHPCIGALDVCPVVYPSPDLRDAAVHAALAAAARLAELALPVFLYGELASTEERRERSHFRRGGVAELARRLAAGELAPDLGPAEAHPSAGGVLVASRPPLVAFNVELDTDDVEVARRVAADLRESGGGMPGVRAIGLLLERGSGRAQVSMNVHDPFATPLSAVVERIADLAAPHRPLAGELVGLAPAAALDGYPHDLAPLEGFEPTDRLLEERIRALSEGPGPGR